MGKIAVEGKKWSVEINLEKTKNMVVTGKGHEEVNIQIGSSRMEQVRKFQYLGVCIEENMSNNVDIKCNIARAKQSFWRNKELSRNNVPLSLEIKITSFELRSYRRILKISWQEKQTNKEVLSKINLGEPRLLKSILKRKARFYGHIARGSADAKS